jgi:hypothetical protein
MAEVLGLVASGISVAQLAGQVTKSIAKLKDYWDQVNEAPAEIKVLLREIDSLSQILGYIRDSQNQNSLFTSQFEKGCFQQCVTLCREGAEELEGLVCEMAATVEGKHGWRRKLGSTKIVLKQAEIKRLKRRMKSAIRLLSLAQACKTRSESIQVVIHSG